MQKVRNKIKKWSQKRYIDIIFVCLLIFVIVSELVMISLYKISLSNIENLDEILETEQYSGACLSNFFENDILNEVANDIRFYVNNIMIVLLPLVTSIVVISISVAKEEIYGVSLFRFRTLDLKAKYSLSEMIMMTIFIVALCVLFECLNMPFTLIILNAFVIVYSVIFVLQEVPILTRKPKKLHKIVKYAYSLSMGDLDLLGIDIKMWREDLSTVIGNMVYEEGIKNIDALLNSSEDKIYVRLDNLLLSLSEKLEHTDLQKVDILSKNVDIALETIDYFFDMILSNDYDDFGIIYSNKGISSLIYWTISASNNQSIANKYGERIKTMLSYNVIPSKNLYYILYADYCDDMDIKFEFYLNFVISISSNLFVKSLIDKNTFYLDCVAENIDDIKNCDVIDKNRFNSYYLLLSFVAYTQFYNVPILSLQKYGKSWNDYICSTLQYNTDNQFDVGKFFDIYSNLLSEIDDFNLNLESNVESYMPIRKIDINDVTNWWICSLAANSIMFVSENTLTNHIDNSNLDKLQKTHAKNTLLYFWSSEKGIKTQLDHYTRYFEIYGFDSILKVKHIFGNYCPKSSLSDSGMGTPDKPISDEEIKVQSFRLFNDIDELIKSNPICDESIILSRAVGSYEYNTNYTEDSISNLLNTCKDKLLNEICFQRIYFYLQDRLHTQLDSELFNLANKLANHVLSPNYSPENSSFMFTYKGKTYYLVDCRFNAEIEMDKSTLKRLDGEELDEHLKALFYDKKEERYADPKGGKIYYTLDQLKNNVDTSFYQVNLFVKYSFSLVIDEWIRVPSNESD